MPADAELTSLPQCVLLQPPPSRCSRAPPLLVVSATPAASLFSSRSAFIAHTIHHFTAITLTPAVAVLRIYHTSSILSIHVRSFSASNLQLLFYLHSHCG